MSSLRCIFPRALVQIRLCYSLHCRPCLLDLVCSWNIFCYYGTNKVRKLHHSAFVACLRPSTHLPHLRSRSSCCQHRSSHSKQLLRPSRLTHTSGYRNRRFRVSSSSHAHRSDIPPRTSLHLRSLLDGSKRYFILSQPGIVIHQR